uniref:C-type lectin domain-containing protein n=1 Tax=Gopherus evgoodei TaxID=1825980 RepID=A0A8C4W0W9_9SAUR
MISLLIFPISCPPVSNQTLKSLNLGGLLLIRAPVTQRREAGENQFLFFSFPVMGVKTQQSCPLFNAASCPMNRSTPSCVDGWVGYRGKCYYFSEAEGNWNNSQSHCSALSASLAVIDTWQDLDFVLQYKGTTDPWIGLRRGSNHHWKWANGTKFSNLFEVRGDANCAFLTETAVSSSRCYTVRSWICNKPYA